MTRISQRNVFKTCMLVISLLICFAIRIDAAELKIVRKWLYSFEGKQAGCLSLVPATSEIPIPMVPLLVGADEMKRFYIIDINYDFSQGKGALRVYSESGEEIAIFPDKRFFAPHHAPYQVACTNGGYIWVGKRLERPIRQRPTISAWAYRIGNKNPVVDLYQEMPEELEEFLNRKLGKNWFKDFPEHEGPALVWDLFAVKDKIILYLYHTRLSRQIKEGALLIDRMLRVELSEDGKKFLSGEVISWSDESRVMSPDGQEWVVRSKTFKETSVFQNHWELSIYLAGECKKKKDISLLSSKEVIDLFGENFKIYPEAIGIDRRGHIYIVITQVIGVLWEKELKPARKQLFHYVLKDRTKIEFEGGRKLILYIFDLKKKGLIYQSDVVLLPYALNEHNWVQLLPDGSGYYELRLLKNEAQVVFHKLSF